MTGLIPEALITLATGMGIGVVGWLGKKGVEMSETLKEHEDLICNQGEKLDHIISRVDSLYDHLLEERSASRTDPR